MTDLELKQTGDHIRLSWTLPKTNTDGSAADIHRIEVYRQMQPRTSASVPTAELPTQFAGEKIISVSMQAVAQFTERGRTVFIDEFQGVTDRASLYANRLIYAVKVINKKKMDAGYSNFVTHELVKVATAVPEIRFDVREDAIVLRWPAPTGNLDGAELRNLIGYNVYRSEEGKLKSTSPLNDEPVSQPSFEDKHFQFGKTYAYAVSVLSREGSFQAESFLSKEFSIQPVDVFPPQAPTGLTAVFANARMNLLWNPNTEADLAGYNVYRSEDNLQHSKLNTAPLKSPTFRDDNIVPGKKYVYRVTAVDANGNESSRSEAVTVEARENSPQGRNRNETLPSSMGR